MLPDKEQYWRFPTKGEIFFSPAAGCGASWSFLGRREWGFSLDRKWIVCRDGVFAWEMLSRRRDCFVLAVENAPRWFSDIVPKLRQFAEDARTFETTREFLRAVFAVSEQEMPFLPELLKRRYGEIAWHPYAPMLDPKRRPFGDPPQETGDLDDDLVPASRWEIRHWRCECGRYLVGFQKLPHWEYRSDVHLPRCGCGTGVRLMEQ